MANSAEYLSLAGNIQDLKTELVPRKALTYSNGELLRSSAFIVFCHAEVEEYYENLCYRIALESISKAIRHGIYGVVASALLAFDEGAACSVPDALVHKQPSKQADHEKDIQLIERLKSAFNRYRHRIKIDNHGIKEKNVLSIVLPVGVTIAQIDPILIRELDWLGGLRGGIAHLGYTTSRAASTEDPSDTCIKIEKIIDMMKSLDEIISSLA